MIYREKIVLQSKGTAPTYFNIIEDVRRIVAKSKIKEGICVVISPHTTCSVFFEEFVHDIDEFGNESLQNDLNHVLAKIIPDHLKASDYEYPGEEHFRAVEAWPDVESYLPGGDRTALFNGDAHIKATLLGSSETFSVEDGKLGMGSTGYIYFVDFDRTRPRKRTCIVTVIGE